MSLEGSIPIRPTDLAPINDWLAELKGRVSRWSDDVCAVSADEWQRLNATVKSAVSTQRVEQVMGDFLRRIGINSHREELVQGLSAELRTQIVTYRDGLSIDNYANYLAEPPKIEF